MSAPTAPAGWRSACAATPLLAWRASQHAAVAQLLHARLQPWRQEWGIPQDLLDVQCQACRESGGAKAWELLGTRDDATAWIGAAGEVQAALSQALWQSGCGEGSIAGAVLAQCVREFVAALASAANVDAGCVAACAAASPPDGAWSGAIEARLSCGARLALDAAAVRSLLSGVPAASAPTTPRVSEPTPLVPLTEALRPGALVLQVHLAACELEVGRLHDLQPGDVVRLSHALDAPLEVRDAGGRRLFGALLARSGASLAVELVPLPQPGAAPMQRTVS